MKILRLLLTSIFISVAHAEPPPTAKTAGFVRAAERADKTTACETLSAEYRPAQGAGPSVWLIGVAHIGTPEYYRAIQARLDRQSVVLFEGVGLGDALKQGPGAATHEAGVQAGLAKALGLVFQLDAIDYRRPHFLNSDLKAAALEKDVKERTKGDPQAGESDLVGPLMDALRGTGAIGTMLNSVVGVLGQNPAMQELTKAVLVESLGHANEFIGLARNASPAMNDLFDVLLTERNAIVIADLRTQLAKRAPAESVAIFYGAAHMDEIAKQLRDELHYVPAKEEWDAAFVADPAKSGMSPVELRFMIEMAKMQLKAMGGSKK